MRRSTAQATLACGVFLLAATLVVGPRLDLGGSAASPPSVASTSTAATSDSLTGAITDLQEGLDDEPEDHEAWATLGGLYVEQARVTSDFSYYPRAEGALEESLELRPEDNDDALTGLGALANARHDFSGAEEFARRALEVNPANSTSWGVLADALIQLGDYDGSTAAVQEMLDLRPGLPSYSRASYDLELHGEDERAREAMELALTSSISPADKAFCRYYLGQLAFNNGDLEEAETQFGLGLDAAADNPALLIGQARVDAARGNEEEALTGYERVVGARPLPEYLVEYGTYLESLGRSDQAEEQFAVLAASQLLFESNGGQDDLTSALMEAERGDPAAAVEHAEREWDLRQNVDSADAMAWALHSAGRDEEALEYAVKATALEGPNATLLYHRGMIEASLGMDEEARTHLEAALETNPYFSPLHAPVAQQALDELGEVE